MRFETVAELERDGVLLVQDGNHGASRPVGDEILPAGQVGIAHVRAADIDDSGEIDFDGAQQLATSAYERIRKGRARAGDTLLSHKGTVGRVARVRSGTPDFLCSPQTTFWRSLKEAVIDPTYLYCYLRSPEFQQQLRQRMHDTDMAPYVSLTAQRSLSLPIHPIGEQRRISRVLGALDDKMDSNRRLAGLLEEMATALFRARFVDFVGVEEFEDSDIGPIPKGWRVERIDQLAAVNMESYSTKRHPPTIQYVDISSVSPGRIDEIRELRFEEAPSRARRKVKSGDTIISTVRPERRATAYVHDALPNLTASTGFAVVSPTTAAPTFIHRWVTSDRCADYLSASASGSAYPAVNPSILAAYRVPVPPDRGDLFDATARPLEALRSLLHAERLTLMNIRDALLPKLVSGQIRVPDSSDPEEAVQAVIEEAA